MKRILPLLSLHIWASLVLLPACCYKVECVDNIPNIELAGFSADEVDTIWMIYHNNIADTIFNYAITVDSSLLTLANNIDRKNNITIVIPGAGRQYELTDFQYETRNCEKAQCFNGVNTYEVFTGCKINGQPAGRELTLNK